MNISFKRFIIFTILLIFSIQISVCETFFRRGFEYNILNDEEVSIVFSEGCDREVLDLDIPTEVKYLGKTYKVVSIGLKAFGMYNDITAIKIPDTIRTIGRESFSYCKNLEEITIPESVTKIGGGAFDGSKKIKKIIILNPIPPETIGDGGGLWCTEDVFKNATLYVPKGSLLNYQYAKMWEKFKHIEIID